MRQNLVGAGIATIIFAALVGIYLGISIGTAHGLANIVAEPIAFFAGVYIVGVGVVSGLVFFIARCWDSPIVKRIYYRLAYSPCSRPRPC